MWSHLDRRWAYFLPNPNDVRLACLEIPREVAIVLLPVGGKRHKHTECSAL